MEDFELPAFLVVPDANALYTKKPECVVSQKFTDLWAELRLITTLRLLVPEVVQQEIIFQQVFLGQKARENAKKSLGTIAGITAKQRPGLPSDKTLRTDVGKTFSAWAKANNVTVINTPVDSISWAQLVKDALHRVPPFSRPSEPGDDSEKGFRDALILETLKYIWAEHAEENVVFICNDSLLHDTAIAQGKDDRHLFFRSIDDFHSHLKLLKEEKNKKFIGLILNRAPLEFWNPDDANNMYNNFQVWNKITTDYSWVLDLWIDADQAPLATAEDVGLSGAAISNAVWTPVGDQKIFIDRTQFDKIEGSHRFHWRTDLRFVRLCQRQITNFLAASGVFGLQPIEKIRTARFTVHWSADISARAKFSNHKLENIEYNKKEYEPATVAQKYQYGFVTEDPFSFTMGGGTQTSG